MFFAANLIMIQTFSHFFSSFTFMQMLMCALLLAPKAKKNTAVSLFMLLMLCSAAYLLPDVFSNIAASTAIWWLSHIGGNALPGAFWLVALTIFSEHSELKKRHYFIASLTLLIPITSILLQWLFSYDLTQTMVLYFIVKYGAMALELLLITHALVIAMKYWRDDLVEQRRYMRGVVISLSAFYIFVVIVIEQLLKLQWHGLDTIKSLFLFLLITIINIVLFRLKRESIFNVVINNNTPKIDINNHLTPQSKELKAIIDAMNKDLLYQQDGITIASFARHLAMHEYKLRLLINGELNYRNFNDFLNFYRIKEVSEKLIQVEFSQTPVLTLALESGFRSLSSFNKAFKDTHHMTPTQYRKKYLP